MSGTQTQNDPFNIYEYTIPGTSLQITVTDPDLINGIIALQGSSIEAVLGDVAENIRLGGKTGFPAFEVRRYRVAHADLARSSDKTKIRSFLKKRNKKLSPGAVPAALPRQSFTQTA